MPKQKWLQTIGSFVHEVQTKSSILN